MIIEIPMNIQTTKEFMRWHNKELKNGLKCVFKHSRNKIQKVEAVWDRTQQNKEFGNYIKVTYICQKKEREQTHLHPDKKEIVDSILYTVKSLKHVLTFSL